MSMMEGELLSEDYGNNLTSVQDLLKKHTNMMSDMIAHQELIL
jgi:hypothetical protein